MAKIDKGRPVGSGAAWRRSPHQKSAGREREKKKRREKRKRKEEKERREEKKERKGEKSKRCIRPMGVKQPLRTDVKRLQNTRKEGGLKKVGREEEETENI